MAIPYESDVQLDDPFQESHSRSENRTSPPPSSSLYLSGSPIMLTDNAPLSSSAPEPTTTHSSLQNQSTSLENNAIAAGDSSTPFASPSSSLFSFGYYQQFFDVNTAQVLNRLTNAMCPVFPPDYLYGRNWHIISETSDTAAYTQEEGSEGPVVAGVKLSLRPDLYGPFWICTSLWITIGVISNVMSRISYAREHEGNNTETWMFDFVLVPVACATIYLYCFVFGSIVWGVMKWKFLPVTLTDTICLYGYSMFVFELIALLCVVPSTAFQWIIVLLGGAWSATYLIVNLWHMLKRNLSPQWFLGLVGTVAIGHLMLTLSLKLYFFRYKI